METNDELIRLSGGDVIELIRETRNDFIGNLLKEAALKDFLFQEFQQSDISKVKVEFIRMALKELMRSSVDLSHYGSLILDIRKNGSLSVSKNHSLYFSHDVMQAIRNYVL